MEGKLAGGCSCITFHIAKLNAYGGILIVWYSLEVFIVSFSRTPFGTAFTGSLSHLSAPELAAHAIKGTVQHRPLSNFYNCKMYV
jgi:hypothetical protein